VDAEQEAVAAATSAELGPLEPPSGFQEPPETAGAEIGIPPACMAAGKDRAPEVRSAADAMSAPPIAPTSRERYDWDPLVVVEVLASESIMGSKIYSFSLSGSFVQHRLCDDF
jgi:hypothetical protein